MAPSKTTIDWLKFRSRAEPTAVLEAVRPLFGFLSPHLHFSRFGKGADHYAQSAIVQLLDMPIARIDYGGETQNGWGRFDMSGKGCSLVQDWSAIEVAEALPNAELARVDVALTTWRAEMSMPAIVAAHAAGKFSCGGRPPNLKMITNTNGAGDTANIGTREKADKCARGYDKGREMLSKLGAAGVGVTEIEGFPIDDIFRLEIEYKNATRPLAWDVVTNPDQYFAGAYPYCSEMLPGVEPDVFMRRPERQSQWALETALANCKRSYGTVLFTALTAYDGDIGKVMSLVMGNKHHEGLVQAGVLLVDHE